MKTLRIILFGTFAFGIIACRPEPTKPFGGDTADTADRSGNEASSSGGGEGRDLPATLDSGDTADTGNNKDDGSLVDWQQPIPWHLSKVKPLGNGGFPSRLNK